MFTNYEDVTPAFAKTVGILTMLCRKYHLTCPQFFIQPEEWIGVDALHLVESKVLTPLQYARLVFIKFLVVLTKTGHESETKAIGILAHLVAKDTPELEGY